VERLSVITDGIGLGIDNKSWTVIRRPYPRRRAVEYVIF